MRVTRSRFVECIDHPDVRPEQIFVDPDCGLKTRTAEEVKEQLANMVEATRQVKAGLKTHS